MQYPTVNNVMPWENLPVANSDNNNSNTDQVKLVPTSEDLTAAASTVLGNPDSDVVGLPPDGIRGLSTTTSQRVQYTVKSNEEYDLWVVQYPFEPVGFADPIGGFVIGFDTAPTSTPNYCKSAGSDPLWTGAGLATTLPVGGLMLYTMRPGQSPFPGTSGPYTPISSHRLNFGPDVLHDNARVVGGFYEVINTTAALYQQGTSTHASIENPTNEVFDALFDFSGRLLSPPAVFPYDVPNAMVTCQQEQMPIGDLAEMTKVGNSLTLAAKEGVYAPARINLEDNSPTSGMGYNAVFLGGSVAAGLDFGTRRIGLSVTTGVIVNSYTHTSAPNTNQPESVIPGSTARGVAYKTNLNMQVSAFTGLTKESVFTVFRKITSHCICNTGSKFFSFAKYGGTPYSATAMAALQAAQENTPDFYPSASNKNGSAWKKMSGVFKKAMKIAAPVVNTAKVLGKDMFMSRIAAVNPAAAAAITTAKALKKQKKAQNAKKLIQASKRG